MDGRHCTEPTLSNGVFLATTRACLSCGTFMVGALAYMAQWRHTVVGREPGWERTAESQSRAGLDQAEPSHFWGYAERHLMAHGHRNIEGRERCIDEDAFVYMCIYRERERHCMYMRVFTSFLWELTLGRLGLGCLTF